MSYPFLVHLAVGNSKPQSEDGRFWGTGAVQRKFTLAGSKGGGRVEVGWGCGAPSNHTCRWSLTPPTETEVSRRPFLLKC